MSRALLVLVGCCLAGALVLASRSCASSEPDLSNAEQPEINARSPLGAVGLEPGSETAEQGVVPRVLPEDRPRDPVAKGFMRVQVWMPGFGPYPPARVRVYAGRQGRRELVATATAASDGFVDIDMRHLARWPVSQQRYEELHVHADAHGYQEEGQLSDYAFFTYLVGGGTNPHAEVGLRPLDCIRGRLLFADGTPVVGGELRLTLGDPHEDWFEMSDAGGYFAVEWPDREGEARQPRGSHQLRFERRDIPPTLVSLPSEAALRRGEDWVLRAERYPATSGVVRYADGSPIPHLELAFLHPSLDPLVEHHVINKGAVVATSDAAGQFEVVLPRTEWGGRAIDRGRFFIGLPGAPPTTISFDPMADPLEVVVPHHRLRVRVLDGNGVPQVHQRLTLTGENVGRDGGHAVTDESGEASYFLPAGSEGRLVVVFNDHHVVGKDVRLESAQRETIVTLSAAPPEAWGTLVLRSPSSEASEATPGDHWTVVVRNLRGDNVAATYAIDNRIELRLPVGTYDVRRSGYAELPGISGRLTSGPEAAIRVRIESDAEHTVEVPWRETAGLFLRVHLQGPDGEEGLPLDASVQRPAGATPTVLRWWGAETVRRTQLHSGRWMHTERLLEPGPVQLIVTASGYEDAAIDLVLEAHAWTRAEVTLRRLP